MRWETSRDRRNGKSNVPAAIRSADSPVPVSDLSLRQAWVIMHGNPSGIEGNALQNRHGSARIRKVDRYGTPENALAHCAVRKNDDAVLSGHEKQMVHSAVRKNGEKDCSGSSGFDPRLLRSTLLTMAEAQEEKALSHHGVPGMHWGEITKEYQPKGYYKQRTMTAAQYKRRKQQQESLHPQYQAAKNAGKRVGDAFFADSRKRQQERQRQAYAEAHPEEKGPDVVDKTTKKVFDHFSLGAYSQLASKFIKDTATNQVISQLKKKSGQIIKVGGKHAGAIGKIVSKPVSLAGQGLIKGGHGLERLVGKGMKKAPKGIWEASKFLGRAGKSSIRGIAKASKWYRGHRQEVRSSIKAGQSFLKRFASTGSRISRLTGSGVQSSARFVQAGAKKLVKLLSKVKRF